MSLHVIWSKLTPGFEKKLTDQRRYFGMANISAVLKSRGGVGVV